MSFIQSVEIFDNLRDAATDLVEISYASARGSHQVALWSKSTPVKSKMVDSA